MHRLKRLLISLLLWLLESELYTLYGRTTASKETQRTMMSRVYQNPAFLQYLDSREEALVRNTFALFLANKIEDARGLAGQVFELRTLRNTLRVCYNYKRGNKNPPKDPAPPRGQTHDDSSDEE